MKIFVAVVCAAFAAILALAGVGSASNGGGTQDCIAPSATQTPQATVQPETLGSPENLATNAVIAKFEDQADASLALAAIATHGHLTPELTGGEDQTGLNAAIRSHDPFTPDSGLTLAQASEQFLTKVTATGLDPASHGDEILVAIYGGQSEDYQASFTAAANTVLTHTGAQSACITSVDLTSVSTINGVTWPTPGTGHITSRYGSRVNPVSGVLKLHAGVDVGAACGTPIVPVMPGTVTAVVPNGGGLGSYIDVRHAGGIFTRYGHMYPSGLYVTEGQVVDSTTVLAAVGTNGNSTGCHLHIELHTAFGKTVDPQPVFGWVG